MRTIMGLRRIAPPAALTGLVALAALAVGVPAGQGADPFVAGGSSTRTVALPASQADQAKTRGRELAAALGLPGLSQSAERLDDRFEHRTYDEVTSFDAAGKEVAITRFETDGTVAMALVLGWQPGHAGHVDRATAERRARAFARAAGLAVDGPPSVEASAGSGGWSIAWPRVVSATPVRGDGLRISLWPDGTFHGLTRIERPLAALPDRQISADEARQAATIWAVPTSRRRTAGCASRPSNAPGSRRTGCSARMGSTLPPRPSGWHGSSASRRVAGCPNAYDRSRSGSMPATGPLSEAT